MPEMQCQVIRDPKLYEVYNKKEKSLEEYLEYGEKYGEEDTRTQLKLSLFVIRSTLCTFKETLASYREVLQEFADISQELEGFFDLDFGEVTNSFYDGLEKYPRFMRNWLARRRAKRYYRNKFDKLRFQLESVGIGVAQVGSLLGIVQGSMNSMISAMVPKKSKKNQGLMIDPKIQAEIDNARQNRRQGGNGGQPTNQTQPSQTASGSTGASSGKFSPEDF